jgi:hypothetical protein
MRILAALFVLVLASSFVAAEPKVYRGLPYADTKKERQTLDVYAPTKSKSLPVAVPRRGQEPQQPQ